MYKTISELASALTDAQLEMLLLLNSGYELVTNEGANYRSWLDIEKQEVKYAVRNATGDILLSNDLIQMGEESISYLYRYKISKKGKDVLEQIALRKTYRLRTAINSIQHKGIDGISYR